MPLPSIDHSDDLTAHVPVGIHAFRIIEIVNALELLIAQTILEGFGRHGIRLALDVGERKIGLVDDLEIVLFGLAAILSQDLGEHGGETIGIRDLLRIHVDGGRIDIGCDDLSVAVVDGATSRREAYLGRMGRLRHTSVRRAADDLDVNEVRDDGDEKYRK